MNKILLWRFTMIILIAFFLTFRTRAWIPSTQQTRLTSSSSTRLYDVANVPESMTTISSNNTSYTFRAIELSKPMGLILEQDTSEGTQDHGVKIVSMSGAAATASKGGIIDACIGDTVVKVGSKDVSDWTLEQVLDEIAAINPVDLTMQRPSTAIPVKFLDTGACIAAQPQMSIGALGRMCNSDIPYKCRNGNCGTCQHVMVTHDANGKKRQQYVRPCIAKVPKDATSVVIIPCDGYDDSCLLNQS